MAKNKTQWYTANRQGNLTNIGNVFLVDNSGNFITDNSGNFLVSTPNVYSPKVQTFWSPNLAYDNILDEMGLAILDEMGLDIQDEGNAPSTPEVQTQWFTANRNGSLVSIGNTFLTDSSGNFLVDNSGNFLIATPNVPLKQPATAWTESEAS